MVAGDDQGILFCLNVIMRLVYPVMILDSLLQQSQPLPVDGSSDDGVWRLLSAVTAYVLAYRGHYLGSLAMLGGVCVYIVFFISSSLS